MPAERLMLQIVVAIGSLVPIVAGAAGIVLGPALVDAGYAGWFGAEYRPRADTRSGLGWLARF